MSVLIICPQPMPEEEDLQAISQCIEQQYETPFFLYLDRLAVDYDYQLEPSQLRFELLYRATGRKLQSEQLRAVWVFQLGAHAENFEVQNPDLRNHLFSEYQSMLSGLLSICQFKNIRVVSPPDKLAAHSNKIRQQLLAQQVGFQLPQQIISSQAAAFTALPWSKQAVIKLLHSHLEMEEGGELPFVQAISPELYEALRQDALQIDIHHFQERIKGLAEYRVVAFGEEAYAFKITGDYEVDWRRDLSVIDFEYEEDCPLNEACIRYLQAAGIRFGSFDFIQSEAGYFFIECNAPGYFLFCDTAGELGLDKRFARYLWEGSSDAE